MILWLVVIVFVGIVKGGQFGSEQSVFFASVPVCEEEFGGDLPEYFYHAPPRAVQAPAVNRTLKHAFLGLFHREFNTDHSHTSPLDPPDNEQASVLPPSLIAQINELCPRNSFFYSFAPRHFNATMLLQSAFMSQPNASEVFRVARQQLHRHEINARVWYYALVGTILNRPDLKGYYLAWALDATPDLFIPNSVITAATSQSARPPMMTMVNECDTAIGVRSTDVRFIPREEENSLMKRSLVPPSPFYYYYGNFRQKRQSSSPNRCILYNGTRGATGNENRLWYFREDVMLNQHHWYWHQLFPLQSDRFPDRRGENFYFMHHNIIARYNAERLSNGLRPEVPIDLRLGSNIGAGYNSGLVDKASGRHWTPRLSDMPLSDIVHGSDPDFMLNVSVSDLSQVYSVLLNHIQEGYLIANRSNLEFPLNIRNRDGVEHVANTLEASEDLSAHAGLYDSQGVHNLLHVVVALATDPDYRCERPTGVMADLTVTMRDPAFYKVHSLVDTVMDRYKMTLNPYQVNGGEWPLKWDGVKIKSVEMIRDGGDEKNFVRTFWNMKRFPLEEGIDGSIHEGDVQVDICHQHLDHEQFMFRMEVDVNNCWMSRSGMGTVRLFMAPRADVDGRRFGMEESRKLMFILDMFQVRLRKGRNIITRRSNESSLTRPWNRSLQEMLSDPDNGERMEYCGCGVPRHLFIPKGNEKGMEFDLFAMVTNYDEDTVLDRNEDVAGGEGCNSPFIFCGIQNRKYPDARPMGYPFDRQAYSVYDRRRGIVRGVESLEEFVGNVPNMQSSVVTIQHMDLLRN